MPSKSHDASSVLGAKEVAGSEVAPRSLAKKLTAAVSGHTRERAEGGSDDPAGPLPAFRTAYLALSKRDLVLVKMKSGLLTMKLTDTALARANRRQIESVAWEGGKLMSQLAISFSNGVVWEFNVTHAARSSAESIVRVLGRKDLLD
jgi:hypothetical protein